MENSDLCTITGFFFGIWLHLCASLIPIPRAAAGCKYRQNQAENFCSLLNASCVYSYGDPGTKSANILTKVIWDPTTN